MINIFKQIGNYKIYDDGEIFSIKSNCFLKHEVTKNGYHQVTLYFNGVAIRKKIHRLVAYCFCNPPNNYKDLTVDHLDGDKSNNNYSNLEWVTMNENNRRARVNKLNDVSTSNSNRWKDDEFRKRTSKNISEGRKRSGTSKGKNNPMFRYQIFDDNGKEYDVQSLANKLGMSYSGAYRLVRLYVSTKKYDKRLLDLKITIKDIKDEG